MAFGGMDAPDQLCKIFFSVGLRVLLADPEKCAFPLTSLIALATVSAYGDRSAL